MTNAVQAQFAAANSSSSTTSQEHQLLQDFPDNVSYAELIDALDQLESNFDQLQVNDEVTHGLKSVFYSRIRQTAKPNFVEIPVVKAYVFTLEHSNSYRNVSEQDVRAIYDELINRIK